MTSNGIARAAIALAVAVVTALGLGPATAGAEETPRAGASEVRVAARALADGHVEVALQTSSATGTWGERIPPSRGGPEAGRQWNTR